MAQMIIPLLALLPTVAVVWVATFLLHSTLLIGSILLLTRLLGMRAMTVQDKLWKVALFGALFSCTVQAGLGDRSIAPRISLPPLSLPASAAYDDSLTTALEPAGSPLHRQPSSAAFGRPVGGPAPRAAVEPGGATSPVTLHGSIPIRWQWLILLFWGLGAAGFTGSLVLQLLRLRARFRCRTDITSGPVYRIFNDLAASRPAGRKVRLTASDRIAIPVAYGIRRPEICVPRSLVRSLAPDQLRSVLAHEMAHIVRRDQVWLLTARLAEGIFFFQPLIRLARRCYQETAEFICDGEAVRRTGERIPLARSLHQMALRQVSTPTALTLPGITGKGSPLNRRIEMILDRNRTAPAGGRNRWFGPLAAALILVFAFLAPGVTAGDDPPRPEEVQPADVMLHEPAAPSMPDEEELSEAEAAAAAEAEREMAAEERAMELAEQEMAETEREMELMEREMADQEAAMELAELEMAAEERAMELAEQELVETEREMELMEREMAEQEEALALEEEALHMEEVDEEEKADSTDGELRQLSRAQREEIRLRHREIQERHRQISRQHDEISREHRDTARRQAEALRQRRALLHSEEHALRAQRRGLEQALRELNASLAGQLTDQQRERLDSIQQGMEQKLRDLEERGTADRTVVASESAPRPEELN